MIKMKVFSFVTLFFFISTVQAQTPTSWKHVSLGSSHTCALSTSNELYCWGNNYSGQLGVGLSDVHRVTRPSMVSLSEDTKQLSLAGTHSCALSIQGNIACWGDNMRYLLGPGFLSALCSKTITRSNSSYVFIYG